MPLESLRGKDCMVRAVISITQRPDMVEDLEHLRIAQVEADGDSRLDPLKRLKTSQNF